MNLKILNFNAYRAANEDRMKQFRDLIKLYDPSICTIQEIHIGAASRIFGRDFQVLVNIEQHAKDQIGICVLVNKSLRLKDYVLGANGRIIGIWVGALKVFNVYPKSGAQNRNQRDVFFNEDLPSLIQFWNQDRQCKTFFAGDFNCIHRREDSLNNPDAHLQPALIKFMKVYKLTDDFLTLKGSVSGVFSRVTNRSATRIDTILSNASKDCTRFEYFDFPLLDHRVVFAEYASWVDTVKMDIPRERFFAGWVISRDLEKDSLFKDTVKGVCEQFKIERDRSQGIFSPSFVWWKLKQVIIDLAKQRAKVLRREHKYEYLRILDFYQMAKEDIANGKNCQIELKKIINDLNKFYSNENEKRIRNAQYLEIKDNVYDINKVQKAKKFENGNIIEKIRVDGVIYDQSSDMVDAVEAKMRGELKEFQKDLGSNQPDEEDMYFLNMLPRLNIDEEDLSLLEGKISSVEVELILEKDVDLDSSPGVDGFTYRFIKLFWEDVHFQEIYLEFLNYIKDTGDFGPIQNIGIMVLKNKKSNSAEYSQKRKITKLPKDVNLLGKIWANRCRDLVLDSIVPKSQYVCRRGVNIVDELRHLRDINNHFLENGGNGSILSIDFSNAFRSVSLRWFDLVMKRIGFPVSFINWFWHMFKTAGVMISINNWKSSVIRNTRGFLEGSPPSMCGWVIASMALIIAIEKNLSGVTLEDGRIFKSQNFADDGKFFLSEEKEVKIVESLVRRFESVSGVKMHRDRRLKKCNILCFGTHRDYEWPDWVNICSEMKVIGGIFTNNANGSLEKLNSSLVKSKFIGKVMENWGLRGTLGQRAYFVNSFCLSKMNYLSQVFKIEPKVIREIKMKALQFVYVGYNERPVQVINFRGREDGGIGLIEPGIKAKSLLIHNMFREFQERGIQLVGGKLDQDIYGPKEELLKILSDEEPKTSSREIYARLRKEFTRIKTSLIPSRIEKKLFGVKWTRSFRNLKSLGTLSAREKEFGFLLCQDLLPVRGRIHRANADKRCLRVFNNIECQSIQDRIHYFTSCCSIKITFNMFSETICHYLDRKFMDLELLHLSFSVSNKRRTRVGTWFAVKFMFYCYSENLVDFKSIMLRISSDIEVYKRLKVKLYLSQEFRELEGLLNTIIG